MYYQPPNAKSDVPTNATSSIPRPSLSSLPSNAPSSPSSYSPTLHKDAKDQLYYSKQPREVYYKPHNLDDYRRIKNDYDVKLGNLGPDLQREEYIVKKEQASKMKEYAKNVRALHQTTGLPNGPGRIPKSSTPESAKQAAKEKRDKAKEYASKIPKPVQPRAGGVPSTALYNEELSSLDGSDDDDDGDDEDGALIREMERKHHMARADVQQIRKEFGLT